MTRPGLFSSGCGVYNPCPHVSSEYRALKYLMGLVGPIAKQNKKSVLHADLDSPRLTMSNYNTYTTFIVHLNRSVDYKIIAQIHYQTLKLYCTYQWSFGGSSKLSAGRPSAIRLLLNFGSEKSRFLFLPLPF